MILLCLFLGSQSPATLISSTPRTWYVKIHGIEQKLPKEKCRLTWYRK